MTRRKQPARDERRREQVEINLLAEAEGRPVLSRARRGCSLPFLGGSLLFLVLEAVRAGLG